MGAQPHQGAGYMDVTDPEVQSHYEKYYGAKVSSEIGYKIPEMFEAARKGDLKSLWLMGEDVVPNRSQLGSCQSRDGEPRISLSFKKFS